MENKKKIIAPEGMVFVSGESFLSEIFLGEWDSEDNYPLISLEEALKIEAEREAEIQEGVL